MNSPDASTFASRLRATLALRGAFAHRVSLAAGLGRGTVAWALAHPDAAPSTHTVAALARELAVCPAWLAWGEGFGGPEGLDPGPGGPAAADPRQLRLPAVEAAPPAPAVEAASAVEAAEALPGPARASTSPALPSPAATPAPPAPGVPSTPAELAAALAALGWSQRRAAAELGCNQSTLSRWSAGRLPLAGRTWEGASTRLRPALAARAA